MATPSPSGHGETAHEALLEVLKQLNWNEEEETTEVQGLELAELEKRLAGHWTVASHEADLQQMVEILVRNGFARALENPEYAWDRGRVVGERYAITTEGKRYLVDQLNKTGRIE